MDKLKQLNQFLKEYGTKGWQKSPPKLDQIPTLEKIKVLYKKDLLRSVVMGGLQGIIAIGIIILFVLLTLRLDILLIFLLGTAVLVSLTPPFFLSMFTLTNGLNSFVVAKLFGGKNSFSDHIKQMLIFTYRTPWVTSLKTIREEAKVIAKQHKIKENQALAALIIGIITTFITRLLLLVIIFGIALLILTT